MSILRRTIPFVLSLFAFVTTAKPQAATVPGDVLAMLRPNVQAMDVANDLSSVAGASTGLRVAEEVSKPMRTWLFRFDTSRVDQAVMLRAFQAHPGVELAQGNHIVKPRNLPNDPDFGQQWHHQNIHSEEAWDITTGGVTALGDTIVVAIIENADLPHPDLVANAWINYQEIPGNGIDDDGNGYVDDVRGWNPSGGNDAAYGGPHGTEVAGMIGAVGDNGLQVTGANWRVKMMPVTYANTLESNVVAAYTYPLVMRRLYAQSGGTKGAFVVATNASWGVDGGQPANAPIWCAMYDTLGAAGVLNCGATTNSNMNVDQVGDLPTACPSDFMISVTATNSSDMRTFSGYGATTIDVGAPGASVVTTTIGGGFGSASGTSFASPLTAGVLALMYSIPCPSFAALAHNSPEEAARQARLALLEGVDQVGNLPGNTVTGGRINAYNSVQLLMDSCSECPVPYNLSLNADAIGSAVFSWNALPGSYTARYRLQGAPDWTALPPTTDLSVPINGLSTCAVYEFQVSADCDSAESGFGPVLTWTSEGCCTAPAGITVAVQDSSTATVSWNTVLASDGYDLRYRAVGATAWTELTGLTSTDVQLTDLTTCTDFELQMRSSCAGEQAPWSASTAFHSPGCGQCLEGSFCTIGADAYYEWIARVQVGQIDRISGNDQGYADPATTAQTTQLSIGDTVTITLAPGYANSQFQDYFRIWMDLDRDGEFSADERVFDAGATTTAPIEGELVVPATATAGPVRMRVVMRYSSAPMNGCTSFDFGEIEDYCVELVNGPLGLSEHTAPMSVQLYPQPAGEVVHFITGDTGPMDLSVMDAAGRKVLDRSFTGGQLALPVADLANGFYAYRISTKGTDRARGAFVVAH